MRKLTLHIILIITLSALCGSCRKASPSHPALSLADSLMETSPDSALTLLCNLDTSILTTPADHPLYHLLLTQAQVKTGITPSPDPLFEAVSYYRQLPDSRELMLSLYYLGLIQCNKRQYDDAIICLLEAERLATDQSDWFYLGLIDRQISIVYHDIYNVNMGLVYSQKSVKYFQKSGNTEYWNYERCNLACTYIQLGEIEKAINLLDSVKDLAVLMKDIQTNH